MKRTIGLSFLGLSLVTSLASAQTAAGPAVGQRAGQAAGQGAGRAAGAQAETAAPAFKKLTRAELDALLKEPTKVLILDVRRPDEIQSIGGFPAYLSIQLADLEKYISFIPKDRAIVTVSNHSGRAGRAIPVLERHGLKIAGGIGAQDYEGEGGTLVKIAAPAAATTAESTTATNGSAR